MRLLLDTHTLLWFIGGEAELSQAARTLIEDPENKKFVSIVSIWEIAIKVSIGKISLATAFDSLFPHQLDINGFELLPVLIEHTSLVTNLPFHHRDPFDRLLIAQAISESMSLVSIDDHLDSYGVNRLW
ncbi:MAG: type II toxin-antitoxin system VapC family toxin [Acidobacteria bacterium]|nr:type II toxin-antitoxin system VapC family toxin [Acidobacteriota bacterium]MBK7034570.1 type II toxin-antitoxin system VapC family toxin [Ignavibacteria bacterium]MBK9529297.1 type II toxin-antitoxin system VapC family toxin [Acidobacteriota bacterium]MBP7475074.1 type II toxin-antitoxin system VapC family toxin [Pyrinomonadaceae bacterium]MBP9109795.1 type II toxin-antitoxin system VapC family toxin [Pyrinomonadaceae bacterium]